MQPVYNTELGDLVVKQILADPDSHNQGAWSEQFLLDMELCGTTRCFAGWTVALGRPEADFDYGELYDVEPNDYRDREYPAGTEYREASRVWIGNDSRRIADLAQELLGLNGEDAFYLFRHMRTVEELVEGHQALSEGKHWNAEDGQWH
jgi:hypothetical protein